MSGAITAVVGGSVVSGLIGSSSSSKAQAAADPFASQRGQYQTMLQNLMKNPTSATQADPSYQWRLQQGMDATNASLASSGMLNSGNRATALTNYAQNQASTEYANMFSRLAQLSGANVGSPSTAGQIAYNQGQSNAAAAGTLGSQVTNWLTGNTSSSSSSGYDSEGYSPYGDYDMSIW